MSDELARQRLELPWVRVDEQYVFDTEDGPKTLADLFDGRSQLIVYHFMFGPDWDEGCPSCSSLVDHVDLPRIHLENHDVTWVRGVTGPDSRSCWPTGTRMGWSFPWASSLAQRIQLRLQGVVDRRAAAVRVQLPRRPRAARVGALRGPGMSAFAAAGRRRVPHLLGLRPGDGRRVGHVSSGSIVRRWAATRTANGWFRRHDSYDVATA